jgi:predicted acyl esterase
MSDGVSIVADVTIPEGDGPFPVILMMSPYGRLTPSTEYVDDGYVHVNADVRGTGGRGESTASSARASSATSTRWSSGRGASAGLTATWG